jgi:CBS domain-containing protein
LTTTTKPLLALTASDLMSRDIITIPQEMSLRAAADLLFQHQIGGAPVVDTDGRCIGVLCATDFMHWAKEGGQGVEDVPLPACPFQVKGRLLTGEEAVICTLAEGDCPLQEMRPTTGGRHTGVCRFRQSAGSSDWQQVTKNLPMSAVRRYMTTDIVTVEPQTPLPELVRTMIDAHIHRVIVVDGQRRPIGVVSSTDILATLADGEGKGDVPGLRRRTSFLDPSCSANQREPMSKPTATLAHPSSTNPASEQKPAAASVSGHPAPNGKAVSEEAVRLRAYQQWQAAGKPAGDDVRFWLEAEQELLQAR